jgi:hypothetical protein
MTDAVNAPTPSTIPLIDISASSARRLRRRSLANLSCMGHCAPTVMQTLLEASRVRAPWLVKASGLPGGIGNIGEECGGVTAPLMLLGCQASLSERPGNRGRRGIDLKRGARERMA